MNRIALCDANRISDRAGRCPKTIRDPALYTIRLILARYLSAKTRVA